MNSLEAKFIITSSLTNGGAICIAEDTSILVATWKTTVWRILIDSSSFGQSNPLINDETENLRYIAMKNKQQAVIANIYPDGHIKYRNAENWNTIRPRCLVKNTRNMMFKIEYHEQD